MARILLWAPAPWVKTAYGIQGAQAAKGLKSLGHEVAIGAYWGLQHLRVDWDDIPVFGARVRDNCYGTDILPHIYEKWNADFVIILADAWIGSKYTDELKKLNVANWMPIDSDPLSVRDELYLRSSEAVPVAMSKFGKKKLEEKNFDPLYIPHSIDEKVFRPCPDPEIRKKIRAEIGATDDTFVIGMNSANRDGWRKGFFEQFKAFQRFRKDSLLYVHTLIDSGEGLDLARLAQDLGIADRVIYPDQDAYGCGEITDEMLVRNFYWSLDALSNCAWGEGFGVAPLEAQFCDIPTVVTNASAMSELAGPGCFTINGDPARIEGHLADWTRPYIDDIHEAWEEAYMLSGRDPQHLTETRRKFVAQYEVDYVTRTYWKPVIGSLMTRFGAKKGTADG